ncbi:MAG TPA: LTA synthase family protein [Povalibacter sp.]|nr:LTA synthase family protein [Povalibacter sp.]
MPRAEELLPAGPQSVPLTATRNVRILAKLALGTLSLGMVYAVLISWLDPALPWPMSFASTQPWWLAALNAVPVLILTAALTIVTRRIVLASWLTALLLGALYAVNTIKLSQLATPLLPDDFHFLSELRLSYTFFSNYLAIGRLQALIAIVLLAVTLLLARAPVLPQLSGRRRALAGLVILGVGTSLLNGVGPWLRLYDPGRLQFEPWAPADSAGRTGLITNLILLHWELRQPTAAAPDVAAAVSLIRSAAEIRRDRPAAATMAAGGADDLPDIVIVQSESLFDPSRLEGADGDYLPHWRRLAKRGWSGDLNVPTFGGGTIRTEFELLTGMPLDALPQVRYPYLQLPRKQMPGLVRTLAQRGYRTTAVHPNGGAFWNRNRAFRALGFDRFIDGREFADSPREGWYVSDAALTDRVMAELHDDGAPQLIMAISIQNHGPYAHPATMRTVSEVAQPVPDGLDADARESWQTYAALVAKTDEEVGRLAKYVQKRQRRTLLLFYGDHLPPLNDVFARLPFVDGQPAQQQPVPWLLLDNRSSQQRTETTASWLLPALLLARAGISGSDDYLELLETLREHWGSAELQNGSLHPALAAAAQLQYQDQLQVMLRQ